MFCSNLKWLYIYLLVLGCSGSAFAQLRPRFASFTVNDGLPQGTVESVAQDNDGFLWIGTEDGLAKYDGFIFKTYRHNTKNPHSLIGDKSVRLWLYRNGQFWVSPPAKPDTTVLTPLSSLNLASVHQKQPLAKVAVSSFGNLVLRVVVLAKTVEIVIGNSNNKKYIFLIKRLIGFNR